MKIRNDKYYTPPDLANYCWDKVLEVIGEENISEVIEPSVGNGAFLNHPTQMVHFAYDIEPECTSDITTIFKADYLTADIRYLYGRLVIGNPPYGEHMNMAQKFFKKSIQIADYIAFILPLSQFNNNNQLFEFDLIHTEDLGMYKYSDKKLHCCLNIYKRPPDGLNKKQNYKLSSITIEENRRAGHQIKDITQFDIGLCTFGTGIIGKIPQFQGQYAKEMYFKIKDEDYKEQIIDILTTTDWEKNICKGTSGQQNLTQWQVCKYLKEQIPELK